MKVKRKHIIVGGLVALTFFGSAFLYWQYEKLKESAIAFKSLIVKAFGLNNINFDIILSFTNPSKIGFTIVSQEHKLYVNNIFLTTIKNDVSQHIAAKQTSDLTLNVQLNPAEISKAKITAADLLKGLKIPVRVEIKVKVSVAKLTLSVPYTYNTTLKELMSPAKPQT